MESLYEDIEYLDPDIVECDPDDNIDNCVECFDDPSIDQLQNEVKENIDSWNGLCNVFLFLVLCFSFVVKVLSMCYSQLKMLQHEVLRLKLFIKNSSDKTKVEILLKENLLLKRNLKREEKKYSKCESEKKSLMQNISKMFNADQINILLKNLKRPSKWSDDSILRSLKTKFACCKKGYNFLRNNNFPLSSIRILQKRLQGINFNPGSWNDVFIFLKVKSFAKCECECVLVVDEMSIVEGKQCRNLHVAVSLLYCLVFFCGDLFLKEKMFRCENTLHIKVSEVYKKLLIYRSF